MESRLKLIIIGFVLLLIGVLLPFSMILGLLKSTLLLNFLAVSCSLAGFITGVIGIVRYFPPRK
jgi:hypothetical protein